MAIILLLVHAQGIKQLVVSIVVTMKISEYNYIYNICRHLNTYQRDK